jgi:hypothetical protein
MPHKNPSMKNRIPHLKDEINKQIERIICDKNNELLEIIYLFYDGYEYTYN